MVTELSFTEAVKQAKSEQQDAHVLLGNGFSIAYYGKFKYASLYERAMFDLKVEKEALFSAFDSWDFEQAIDYLETAAVLAELYESDQGVAETFRADALVIRNGLAETIAEVHPHNANLMADEAAEHAQAFLKNFGNVFTVNYDLLLYWVVNKQGGGEAPRTDGFLRSQSIRGELIWSPSNEQAIFYLHGGLHLFERDVLGTEKLRYRGKGGMIDDIQRRIRQGHYPLFVSEGRRKQKKMRIAKSPYLSHALSEFSDLSGALFVHGFSFSPNDAHITAPIEAKDSKITSLYVSTHGPSSEVIGRAGAIKDARARNGGPELNVYSYPAESAAVWREP